MHRPTFAIPIKVPVVPQVPTPVTDDEVQTPPVFNEDDAPEHVMSIRSWSGPFRPGGPGVPAASTASPHSPWHYQSANDHLMAYLRMASHHKPSASSRAGPVSAASRAAPGASSTDSRDGNQEAEDDYGWITAVEDDGHGSFPRHVHADWGRSRSRSQSSTAPDGGHDVIVASAQRTGGGGGGVDDDGLIFGDLEL